MLKIPPMYVMSGFIDKVMSDWDQGHWDTKLKLGSNTRLNKQVKEEISTGAATAMQSRESRELQRGEKRIWGWGRRGGGGGATGGSSLQQRSGGEIVTKGSEWARDRANTDQKIKTGLHFHTHRPVMCVILWSLGLCIFRDLYFSSNQIYFWPQICQR